MPTNRLTTTGYVYDKNGSLTQNAAGERFTYDAEKTQKEFFEANNGTSAPDVAYFYDGDGRRVKKISSTEITIFVYDAGGQLVAEYSTQTSQTPRVSYLTPDHLGSPRIVTDENGAVVDRKDYTAFGEETISAERTSGLGYVGADEVRKGYTGYEKDNESGLDFAQARYYNSSHGRYTSVDPLTASSQTDNPQTFNRYSYVVNDPLNLVDPSGLSPCSAEYSYSDCGGDSGFWGGGPDDFGDDVAYQNQTYGGMPAGTAAALALHFQRISNSQAGFGFVTNDETYVTTDIPFWIWWGTNSDGSKWTHFDFNINVHGSNGRSASGGLNDNGKALIQEMGRWGPVLQKTTNTMGGLSLAVIASPYVVTWLLETGVVQSGSVAVRVARALRSASTNPRIYSQLEKQLAKDGSRSIFRSLEGATSSLKDHIAVVNQVKYSSSIEKTIINVSSQIKTILQFISDKGLNK